MDFAHQLENVKLGPMILLDSIHTHCQRVIVAVMSSDNVEKKKHLFWVQTVTFFFKNIQE